jgi:thioredoxin 1
LKKHYQQPFIDAMKLPFLVLMFCITVGYAQDAKVSIEDFEKKLSQQPQAQLIDVRTPGEYSQGHLKNAKNIDYRGEAFAQQIAKLDKNKAVFVYCLSGGRSGSAAKVLKEQGFTEVYDLTGGFLKWSSAGKPVATVAAAPAAKSNAMSREAFDQLVASDKPVFIDFFATWCGPCQQMMPTIQKFKTDYKGKAAIHTIDYDDNKELARELRIDEIPVLLIYKKGKVLWRGIGFTPEPVLRKALDEAVAAK